MKEYYLYLDEGGIFGNIRILISEYFIYNNENEETHISNYYCGKMTLNIIMRYIELLDMVIMIKYPKCLIYLNILVEDVESVLKNRKLKYYSTIDKFKINY